MNEKERLEQAEKAISEGYGVLTEIQGLVRIGALSTDSCIPWSSFGCKDPLYDYYALFLAINSKIEQAMEIIGG